MRSYVKKSRGMSVGRAVFGYANAAQCLSVVLRDAVSAVSYQRAAEASPQCNEITLPALYRATPDGMAGGMCTEGPRMAMEQTRKKKKKSYTTGDYIL